MEQCARFPQVLTQELSKAHLKPHTFKLKCKGTYTAQARALARSLVRSGCAQEKVGTVLQLMGHLVGVSVKERMSARTVRRVIFEGGIASDIQAAHTILRAKSEHSICPTESIHLHVFRSRF